MRLRRGLCPVLLESVHGPPRRGSTPGVCGRLSKSFDRPPPVGEEPDEDEKPPPAPPGLKPGRAQLVREFDGAVAVFKNLLTKRAADFSAASASKVDLETIAHFLLQVANERSEAS